VIVESAGLSPLRFRLAFDRADGSALEGRQSGSFWNLFRWVPLGDGEDFTLTRLP
jgi:hypothetical protein